MITHAVKLSDIGGKTGRLLTWLTSISQNAAAEETPKKKKKEVKKTNTPNAEASGKKTNKKKQGMVMCIFCSGR